MSISLTRFDEITLTSPQGIIIDYVPILLAGDFVWYSGRGWVLRQVKKSGKELSIAVTNNCASK